MISEYWTALCFYVTAFFKGVLHRCDHCGRLADCYNFREQTHAHWTGMQLRGWAGPPTTNGRGAYPDIPEPYASMRVCMRCDHQLSDVFDLHKYCCGRGIYVDQDLHAD